MQTETMPNQKKYRTLWAKKLGKNILADFWKQFQEDKLNPILFYDGELPDFEAFRSWLTSPDKDSRFVISQGGEIKALYWLNNPLGKCVMIHFCVLRKAFGEKEAIGHYVVRSLLDCKKTGSKKDEYVLSALIGITPKPYRHALDFIKKLGFEIKGELPKACWFERKNMYADAVFSMLTRENLTNHINK